jgi:glycosyltransferase involved in cell wall biosynthesis
MRILITNYRYFVSGGPERYLFGVKRLFESFGHEIIPFSISYSKNVYSEWNSFFARPISSDGQISFKDHTWNPASFSRALSRTFFSKEVYHSLTRLIEKVKPDISYVLHYLRKLSPSVLVATKDAGLPLIVRLSDFAMLCPEAHFMRNSQPCELCKKRKLWPSLRYRCVQGSFGASLVNALATLYHHHQGYFDLIDAFVTPTELMKIKMIEGGWPAERIFHIPTFVDLNGSKRDFESRKNVITYIGRIHPIKGLDVLIDAFKMVLSTLASDAPQLIVAGDDQTKEALRLKTRVREEGIPNITFAGLLDKDGVAELLSTSRLNIVPSLCFENMPNVLLESFSCGTPVLTSDLGCFGQIVEHGKTGLLFETGNPQDLAEKTATLLSDITKLSQMSINACKTAEHHYSGERHYQRLEELFDRLAAK